jgi:PQQ-like domain
VKKTAALALALACCAAAATAPAAGAARHDWTRFGFDAARSNNAKVATKIKAGDLSKLVRQDVAVPGTVDSSLVYLHDVKVAGKKRDVFFANSSYGISFALDATTGTRLWTFAPSSAFVLQGGPQITQSSPVVDRKAGFVYVATPDGRVRKLRLKDGQQVTSRGWPARIARDPAHEKIGTALNLSGRYVLATTGGYTGDAPPYQGKVALINRSTGRIAHVFHGLCSDRKNVFDPATCSESGSAIWGRAGAVVMPKSHRILVSTGDGRFDGKTHWGDSVLELSANATRLAGNWTPTNQSDLETSDVDLGSTAPALLRSGKRWFALQGGKDGKLRLLDVANLNGRGKACDCTGGQLQTFIAPGGNGTYTAPAVWRHDGHPWAFVTGLAGGTAGYRLSNGKHPKLHKVWENGNAGTSPVVAGGLLWVYDPGGGVEVYRPATGKSVGNLASDGGHWNSPVIADGRVAIPTGNSNAHGTTGTVTIYRRP